MRCALITPEAFTRSYLAGSSNMMSNVSSNGPAFLLRITFAKSDSVCAVTLFHFLDVHRKNLAGLFKRHQVIHGKAIRGAHGDAERRKRICHVAGGGDD